MKKKLIMILTAVLIICTCGLTTVMPAFAGYDIDSRGSLLLKDGDVAYYSDDIEKLNADVVRLSDELPGDSYAGAQDKTLKNDLKSKGIINYDSGKVVFDSADLMKLSDGIDDLNVGYKYEAVRALNTIGTFFKENGEVTYDKTSGSIAPENASKLSFSDICTGILKSQSVDHLAGQNILAASEDNLSEGSAAWVNGRLLIGNGNDNKAFYDQGYEEGKASVPKTNCYFLGTSAKASSGGSVVYNISSYLPESDYKQLTTDNFIICPYKVNYKIASQSAYLSNSSNITAFCAISESDIPIAKSYDAETGKLVINKPTISARGGISSMSDLTVTAAAELDFYVYLIVGDIINCS